MGMTPAIKLLNLSTQAWRGQAKAPDARNTKQTRAGSDFLPKRGHPYLEDE